MTSTQTAKYSSYNKLVAFLLTYVGSFTGLTRLIKTGTDFKASFSALKIILPSSTLHPSNPVTTIKNLAFTNMINLIVSLAKRAFLFAVDTSSTELETAFNIETSSFPSLTEPARIILAQNVLVLLNSNSAALIAGYDINAAELTAMDAAITLAQGKIAAPQIVIGNNKTANQTIAIAFRDVDRKIVLMEKAIYGKFKTGTSADDALIESFDNANSIIVSVDHTALIVTFVDVDGNPVEKATVEIVLASSTKVAISDIMGVAAADTFVGGTYHVNSSAPTYVSQTQIVKFLMGKAVHLTIILLKA